MPPILELGPHGVFAAAACTFFLRLPRLSKEVARVAGAGGGSNFTKNKSGCEFCNKSPQSRNKVFALERTRKKVRKLEFRKVMCMNLRSPSNILSFEPLPTRLLLVLGTPLFTCAV